MEPPAYTVLPSKNLFSKRTEFPEKRNQRSREDVPRKRIAVFAGIAPALWRENDQVDGPTNFAARRLVVRLRFERRQPRCDDQQIDVTFGVELASSRRTEHRGHNHVVFETLQPLPKQAQLRRAQLTKRCVLS